MHWGSQVTSGTMTKVYRTHIKTSFNNNFKNIEGNYY